MSVKVKASVTEYTDVLVYAYTCIPPIVDTYYTYVPYLVYTPDFIVHTTHVYTYTH